MLNGLNMDETCIETGRLSQFGTRALRHADAKALYQMWTELRGDRPAPFRAEIDAGRIGAAAPFLAILESVGPFNYRVRLAGDRMNRWYGMELRGMSALSMLTPAGRNHLLAVLNRVTAEPSVASVTGRARRPDGLTGEFEMALLPMRSDFGRVDRVLLGLWLHKVDAMSGGPFLMDGARFLCAPVDEDAAEIDDTEPAPREERRQPEPAAAGPLTSIEGGSGGDGVRRAHLRLVKNS